MAEDSGFAANWISAADIEVVNPSSNAVEEHGSKSSHAEEIKKQGGKDLDKACFCYFRIFPNEK